VDAAKMVYHSLFHQRTICFRCGFSLLTFNTGRHCSTGCADVPCPFPELHEQA